MCESPEWIGRVVQARTNAPARSCARPMRAKHITPDHAPAQGETSVQRFALASALLLAATACAFAQTVSPGYPADYQALLADAQQGVSQRLGHRRRAAQGLSRALAQAANTRTRSHCG